MIRVDGIHWLVQRVVVRWGDFCRDADRQGIVRCCAVHWAIGLIAKHHCQFYFNFYVLRHFFFNSTQVKQ